MANAITQELYIVRDLITHEVIGKFKTQNEAQACLDQYNYRHQDKYAAEIIHPQG